MTLSDSRSKLILSGGIFRKLMASIPFGFCISGMMGGTQLRNKAKLTCLKKGCALTSEAPARDPSRRFSSLTNNLRIKLLQLLDNDTL